MMDGSGDTMTAEVLCAVYCVMPHKVACFFSLTSDSGCTNVYKRWRCVG